MKKSIIVFFLLTLSVTGVWAQRSPVKLTALSKEAALIYTTKDVVLKFDKQSFLDMYASMEKGTWVDYYTRENKAAITSIEWLKNQKKPVQLDENMTDQSMPETALAWLVQNLIGAPLILKGRAEIYELKGKQKKEVIEVMEEVSELSGKSYTFFYPGQPNEFLKIWNVNERVAVTQEEAPIEGMAGDVVFEEVVFEEPKAAIADDPNKVYYVTEIQPEYPGGVEKWIAYVNKSLKYPKDAASQKVEGTVYVQFVVSETGELTDFQVVKGISTSCDKEALRLCKESINWKPGKQGGKAVKVRYVMPIKFRLSDTEKK